MAGYSRSVLMLSGLSVIALAACGRPDYNPSKTRAPMPPVNDAPAAAPVALMPSHMAGPVTVPASATVETPVIGDPIIEAVPAPQAQTIEARVARIEDDISAMRTDIGRMTPAFARLNATNERVERLLSDLEASGKPAAKAKPAAKPVAAPKQKSKAPAPEKPAVTAARPVPAEKPAAAPASASTGDNVTALRLGEHDGRTRLVFDVSGASRPKYSQDLDNGEHLLLVEMPGTGWKGAASGRPKSPLVAGWSAQPGASGGSTIAIQLKADARVQSTEFIAPEGGEPARLVIDLAPAR